MQKNAKNAAFFYKERKRTQKTQCSLIKNAKERKNVAFFYDDDDDDYDDDNDDDIDDNDDDNDDNNNDDYNDEDNFWDIFFPFSKIMGKPRVSILFLDSAYF